MYYDNTEPAYKNFIARTAAKVINLCVDEGLTLSEAEDVLHLATRSAKAQVQVLRLGRVKPDELPVFKPPVNVVTEEPPLTSDSITESRQT